MITGASRSGTTMLSRILGNHRRVLRLKESHYFGDLWGLDSMNEAEPPERASALAAQLHARCTRGLFMGQPLAADFQFAGSALDRSAPGDGWDIFKAVTTAMAGETADLVCEQTPRNIFYAAALLERDESIRFVHLVRDPRAVCASQKNRWRRRQLGASRVPRGEMIRVWANYHPRTVARLWLRAQGCAESLQQHPRFMRLRFEDLVNEPVANVRRICDFVGIEFEPAMLDVPQVGSSQGADHGGRGISPKVLSSWETVLGSCEQQSIEELCGNAMQRYGYPLAGARCGVLGRIGQRLGYPLHVLAALAANPRRVWIQAKGMVGR